MKWLMKKEFERKKFFFFFFFKCFNITAEFEDYLFIRTKLVSLVFTIFSAYLSDVLTKYYWLVGWFLWHINPCRLFNAKSCLYIYIKYIWFGNSLYRYIFKQAWAYFFCTQLNDIKYFYLIWIFLFTINHLFAHS